MRILGHIHTFNDEDVVDRSVRALLDQTRPVDRIVLVDNGSRDGTLRRVFPAEVTVIRHAENLGTSCSVRTGLEYALARDFDWLWVLDADSLPRKDALEALVSLYESFDPTARAQVGVISSSHALIAFSDLFSGRCLTPGGSRPPKIDATRSYCECDSTIWSGSLFSLRAVRSVGFPRCGGTGYWEDLSLDYGDLEFTYRVKRAGYRVLVHRASIIDHPVGKAQQIRLFGRSLTSTNHSATRRYLFFRNLVYFWLHLYPKKNWLMLTVWFAHRCAVTALGILLIEEGRASKLRACVRGIWDGLRGNINRPY